MFGWLRRDPVKALEARYERKLVEARDVQRYGDIVRYSKLIAESEEILQEIDALKGDGQDGP